MSFDGLFTHAMILELEDKLVGGRISKVYQPYDQEIVIRIRANRTNYDLLLSAHPQYARMQITKVPFDNPQHPPHFCMILRKYLENGFLKSIHQDGADRLVEFRVSSRNELGDEQDIVLVAEIMGRHSNLILVDHTENKIINSIKHISPSQNSYRTILPRAPYVPAPSQGKANPYNFTDYDSLKLESAKASERHIMSTLEGFSKQSAKELAERLHHGDQSPQATYQSFMKKLELNQTQPSLYKFESKEKFSPFNFSSLDGKPLEFESLSALLDRFYDQKAERDRVHQLASDLYTIVGNELKKNERKLEKIKSELKETQFANDYRVQGEVLTAFLHEVDHGMESITLGNFYEENQPIEIKLDPQKSPSENTQYYFSRYQKMKNRKVHLDKQIVATEAEIHYLESVLTHLDDVSLDDIEEIRDELRETGYLKSKQKNKRAKKNKKSKPLHFRSTDGTDILVGRNNTQNDELTTRKANRTDWWLHTQNIPGSHVIVRSDQPTAQTMEQAAHLAAYYSKYRESAQVPVDAVQVKYINKPNGAKPGFVTYEGQDTYFVTPSKDLVERLSFKEMD